MSTGKLSTGKIVNWQNCQQANCQLAKSSISKLFTWQILPGKMVAWQLCHVAKCYLVTLSIGKVVTYQRTAWKLDTWQSFTGKVPNIQKDSTIRKILYPARKCLWKLRFRKSLNARNKLIFGIIILFGTQLCLEICTIFCNQALFSRLN